MESIKAETARQLTTTCSQWYFQRARGSVLAEELFRAVLWRAARTDYAEFLQTLPVAGGVDVAFLEDGYAYHTSQDRRVSLKSTGSEAATLVDVVERLEGVEDDAEVVVLLRDRPPTPQPTIDPRTCAAPRPR